MALPGEEVRLFDPDPVAAQAAAGAAGTGAAGRVSATETIEAAVAGTWLVIECIPRNWS